MREPSRKHGHYDQRWPAWPPRSTSTTPNGVTANRPSEFVTGVRQARDEEFGRGAIDAWEAEGGSADSRPSHENGRVHLLEQESVADDLRWEMFCETFYPDKKTHHFPAIIAWSRYRDGDRSWPEGARQRARALISCAVEGQTRPQQPAGVR